MGQASASLFFGFLASPFAACLLSFFFGIEGVGLIEFGRRSGSAELFFRGGEFGFELGNPLQGVLQFGLSLRQQDGPTVDIVVAVQSVRRVELPKTALSCSRMS